MYNALCVKRVKGGEYIADYLPRLAPCQRADDWMEQVHRVEWVFAFGAENVDADDPWMRELREAASLGDETPAQSGGFPLRDGFARCENLHREVGVQRFVVDAPNFTCRSTSEKSNDAKASDCFVWMQKMSLSRFGLVQGVVRLEVVVDVSLHPASSP